MISDLDHLPAPELTHDRQDAMYSALVATITAESAGTTRRSWARQHRRLTVGVAAFVVVGSTSTAVAARYLSGTATPSDSLYCYSQVSSDTGDNAPGTAVMVANPTLPGGADPGRATITDPVGLCSNLYRQGVLTLGLAHQARPFVLATNDPVPRLTACVRTDGAVAVEPGSETVCAEVGMVPFTGYNPTERRPAAVSPDSEGGLRHGIHYAR